MKQLKKAKWPVILTVQGKAAAVVMDAAAYQRLLAIGDPARISRCQKWKLSTSPRIPGGV